MSGHYSGHTARDHAFLTAHHLDPSKVDYVAEPAPCAVCARPTMNLAGRCAAHYDPELTARWVTERLLASS